MSWFDWTSKTSVKNQLPEIFPMPIIERDFITIDNENIFSRILIDVLERTQGLPPDKYYLFWDNSLGSEKQDGLVSMISKAICNKSDLYLVYNRATGVLRKATQEEQQVIAQDYRTYGESKAGYYITFRNYIKSDMIRFYSKLEYSGISGLWKQSNISKTIEFKLHALRESVGAFDATDVIKQSKELAEAMASGRDIAIDSKDSIEMPTPDMEALSKFMSFIAEKRAFYLGLPQNYLVGTQNKGLGDSGKGESKAIERGLKPYYYSIVKPIFEAIFQVKTTFKSEDQDMIGTGLEVLKTMDITSDEYLSKENKALIVNKTFGIEVNS